MLKVMHQNLSFNVISFSWKQLLSSWATKGDP